jgi:prevent-host-death family protein
MTKKHRVISAGEFKMRCLALLDEVAHTGEPILVTKRGKPVAKLVPARKIEPEALHGSIVRESDVVRPVDAAWDAAS